MSSTFDDLQAERQALHEQVFPRLRKFCAAHNARFQPIDLRWGVSEEAVRDQRTMDICLAEIKRCQDSTPWPNFIVLLGERYGWRPPPATIPVVEFEALRACVPSGDLPRLNRWYLRDDNVDPPAYRLKARETEFKEQNQWKPEEQWLQSALLKAAKTLGLDAAERFKYEASATEQEIEAGVGVLRTPDASKHTLCFLRTIRGLDNVAKYIDEDPEVRARQQRLRDLLRARLGRQAVCEYEAEWTGNGITTEHVPQLCEDVYGRLSALILAALEPTAGTAACTEPDVEVDNHLQFGEARARFFTGRTKYLDAITAYVRGGGQQPLALFGASGSGKSSLMARASEQVAREHPTAVVIVRFIGATPASSNARALLEGVCRNIAVRYGVDDDLPPSPDYKTLVDALTKRLKLSTPERPLVIFLDALDQLDDTGNARDLAWLPTMLPAHTTVIVSMLPGQCLDALTKRLSEGQQIELDGMTPDEGDALLDAWLADAGRRLTPKQRSVVLDRFEQHRLPLWLKLAFEQTRDWPSWEEPACLPADVSGLVRYLLDSLSAPKRHGHTLVERCLGYIRVSRHGLGEGELLDVLSADPDVREDLHKRFPHSPAVPAGGAVPTVLWARLYADLKPYLSEREADGAALQTFFHREFAEVIKRFPEKSLPAWPRNGALPFSPLAKGGDHAGFGMAFSGNHLNGELLADGVAFALHRRLARYFGRQRLQTGGTAAPQPNLRKLSELPFQQVHGELWRWLQCTLTNFLFLEAKTSAVGPQPLIEDFELALSSANEKEHVRLDRDGLRAIQGALRLAAPVLAAPHSKQLAVQLRGRLSPDDSRAVQRLLAKARPPRGPWLCPLIPSLWSPSGNLLGILPGHSRGIQTVAITPNGRYIVSGSSDEPLQVWDAERLQHVRTLPEPDSRTQAVVFTPDGRWLVSGGTDGKLRVWDAYTWEQHHIYDGHARAIRALAVAQDSRRVVSGSFDGTVRVWDVETGESRPLSGVTALVAAVAVTPDGRRVFSGTDTAGDPLVRVWEADGNVEPRELPGHARDVLCLAVTQDGRWLVSGARDKTLRVWDIETGACSRTLTDHRGIVTAVTVTPNGRVISGSGSEDFTVKVWDIDSGAEPETLQGHTADVKAVAVTADGRRVVSASDDKLLRVWDLTARNAATSALQHLPWATCVVVSADAKRLVTAGDDGTLRPWGFGEEFLWPRWPQHSDMVTVLAMTPDERMLVSGALKDGSLYVWDTSSGEMVWATKPQGEMWFHGLALLPDGRRMVGGRADGIIEVWSLHTRELLRAWEAHGGSTIRCIAAHPDGRRLLSGDNEGLLKVWDIESGTLLRTLKDHELTVSAVVVTPDGRRVVTGSWDGDLRVWDLDGDTPPQRLKEHTDFVTGLALMPDGHCAVSVSDDRCLKVWDIDLGLMVTEFTADSDLVCCAVAATDGMIAAADHTGRIHLLRLEGV